MPRGIAGRRQLCRCWVTKGRKQGSTMFRRAACLSNRAERLGDVICKSAPSMHAVCRGNVKHPHDGVRAADAHTRERRRRATY